MAWTRGILAVLAVCVTLSAGSVGCGVGDARETGNRAGKGESPTAVGRLLDETDEEGRHYREVDEQNAPAVGIEVQPESDGSWGVRLALSGFRLSPPGTHARAAPGQGIARIYVDDRLVARLRTPEYRLAAVPRGTHQVTARLYADDGTVWAAAGKPVECTADLTVSEPASASGGRGADEEPQG